MVGWREQPGRNTHFGRTLTRLLEEECGCREVPANDVIQLWSKRRRKNIPIARSQSDVFRLRYHPRRFIWTVAVVCCVLCTLGPTILISFGVAALGQNIDAKFKLLAREIDEQLAFPIH